MLELPRLAVVEEHFLDQKRITFKFKRRKNYKRYLGSRHAMTTLRITAIESDLVDIQPTQVPETETTGGGSAAQKRQGSVGGRVQE